MRRQDPSERSRPFRSLAGFDLFKGLDATFTAKLGGAATAMTYRAGDYVFVEGDVADSLFFLVSGSVSVHIAVGERTTEVVRFEPGAVFGERAALRGGDRRSTRVRAERDAECLVLPVAEIESIGEHFPHDLARLYANLAWILSSRLRQANRELRVLDL